MELGYDSQSGESEDDPALFMTTGWTSPIRVDEATLINWIETMCRLGFANDAVFDNGFSGGSVWMSHTSPEFVVASANGDTHPRVNATSHINGLAGVTFLCTNVHGDIEVRVTATGSFAVTGSQNPSAACQPGTSASSLKTGTR